MKVGLIGFPSAGKSTLYRAAARGLAKGEVTAVPVPDERFDAIVRQVRPKKMTPASVMLHDDIESAQQSGRMLGQRLLDSARKMDVLLHVVRAFETPPESSIREQEAMDVELLLADLQMAENRLERLSKSLGARNPGTAEYMEAQVFETIRAALESGSPVRSLDLDQDAQTVVRNYQLLSAKQIVVAFNVSEQDAAQPAEAIARRCRELGNVGVPAFAVCAPLEEEIAQLDQADQPEFLESLGLSEPASARVIRAVYDALGLITFFTAGENETRAWPLPRGSSALKAADTIHSDIARGFIRAEIVHFEDYAAAGSLDAAYSGGKMRLEGKDYVIQDGDLIHVRNKS